MTGESPEVAAARIEAERARAQPDGHRAARSRPGSAQARWRPNAWQEAKEKGADLAEDAVDAVRKRPVAATGVVAAIALFLAREPLKDLAGKVTDGMTASARREPGRRPANPTETVA